MAHLAGGLLVVLVAALYVLAIRIIWRFPFRALGVLMAGAAIHNILVMLLLRLGMPAILIRVVQAWKEGILLLLAVIVARYLVRGEPDWRRPRWLPVDILAIVFTGLVVLYLVIPPSVFGSHATLAQRLLGARVLLQLPLLYGYGRFFFTTRRSDLLWNFTVIAGSAGIVGILGFIEVWYIPTREWLTAGVNQFSAWLGFHYHGPFGLPENFFQSAGQGLFLRRMVSTYVSPLPIAYTGLLVLPLAAGLLQLRRQPDRSVVVRVVFIAFLVIGVVLSVTRLAMIVLVGEFFVLALLWRTRWLLYGTLAAGVLVAAVFVVYVRIGPVVDANLQPVHHRPPGLRIVSTNDSSFSEHSGTLAFDIQYALRHPLGTGVGTSINRFGIPAGIGESADFDVAADIGVAGALAYALMYGLSMLSGFLVWLRARADPLLLALPLVTLVGGLALLPITVTSDVWSDPSVTYLFWWSAGFTVSAATYARTRSSAGTSSRLKQASS